MPNSVAPLRVAIVSPYPPSKGTLNEYAFHFVRSLAAKPEVGAVIVLADALPPGVRDERPAPGDKVRVVRPWRFGSSLSAARIVAAARRARPDVVLFNIQFTSFGGKKVPATLGLLAPALVKAAGFPTVVLLHNIVEAVDLRNAGFAANALLAALFRKLGGVVTRQILRADLVALTMPQYVETFAAKYRTGNVVLAPHGTFAPAEAPEFDPPPGPLRILTFGKFGTYKRVEPLIEAYRRVCAALAEPLELVIAGSDSPNTPGYLDGVRARYADTPGLRFTGYVPEADVPDLFRSAAVVAFPYTSTTGSSGVLHQAGAYGRAVVMPRLGDLDALLDEEGFAGEFFAPDDDASLADALLRVLGDPAHRRELGRRNWLVANGLPLDDVVDWYILHFQDLLARRAGRRAGLGRERNSPGTA